MDHHVEGEIGERHPQESAPSSTPDADSSYQQDDALYDIAPYPFVLHKDRAEYKGVFQEMLTMELDRFTKEILVDRRKA